MKNQIKVYKLSSGEEIIGMKLSSSFSSIKLGSALRLERMSNEGVIYYTMRSWFVNQFDDAKENTTDLRKAHIMASFDPAFAVIKQYNASLAYLTSPPTAADHDNAEPDHFSPSQPTIH